MDLEHLNRKQVILLALLVSFVTSIATGIVTVSLMNQAPPQVAATVNHVIERTVQQVIPATQTAAPVTVKTVVVKDDDLATQSIANAQKSIIRIVDASTPDTMVARGIVIDAKGVALVDRGSLSGDASYLAILPDGSRVPVSVRSAATTTPVALLDLKLSTTTAPLVAASFADPSKLALGQTVFRIGGTGTDIVGQGVIAALLKGGTDTPQRIEATVVSTIPGSVLVTLYGDVAGMTTSDSLAQGSDFYSVPSFFKAAAASEDAKTAAASSGSSAASH